MSYRGLVGRTSDGGYQWSVIDGEGRVVRTGTATSQESAAEAVEKVFDTIKQAGPDGLPPLQS